MLHFAYFLVEFRGIPPREPPISGTRVTTNWAGERPTRHHVPLQVGICIAVSCRFSLCAVELPASCAGAAVRAPASPAVAALVAVVVVDEALVAVAELVVPSIEKPSAGNKNMRLF